MNPFLVLLTGLLFVHQPFLWAQSPIKDLQTNRRPGTLWVDVTYHLLGPEDQKTTVLMEASTDSGQTYYVPVLSVLGDIGPVEPGGPKHIVWDAGADAADLFSGPWQIRLLASPSPAAYAASQMVLIPAGPFTMGSNRGDPHEQPVHQVYLKAYWMDRFEVTNRAFMHFVQATAWQTAAQREGRSLIYVEGGYQTVEGASWKAPSGADQGLVNRLDHPVVQVDWYDADAYCRWAAKRLPTEAEWEKGARGTDQRPYTWGWERSADSRYRANYGADQCCRESDQDGFLNTAPVGSFPQGVSPYGLSDMAGNVWEWTQDWYGETYYASSPSHNPTGPDQGRERVLRGGSWISYWHMLRTTYRGVHAAEMRHNYGGFRCARDE